MILDIACKPGLADGYYASANCEEDTGGTRSKTNNYSHLEKSTDGYCKEVWKISDLAQRCVRAGFKTVR